MAFRSVLTTPAVQRYATPLDMLKRGSIHSHVPGGLHQKNLERFQAAMGASSQGIEFYAISTQLARGEFLWARASREDDYAAIERFATASLDPDATMQSTATRVYTTAEMNRHLADLQLQGSFAPVLAAGTHAEPPALAARATPRYRTVRELLDEIPMYCLGCISACTEIPLDPVLSDMCSVYGPVYPGERIFRVRTTIKGPVEHARNVFDEHALAGYSLMALLARVPTTATVGRSFLTLQPPQNSETLPLFSADVTVDAAHAMAGAGDAASAAVGPLSEFDFPTEAREMEPDKGRAALNASVYDVHPRNWIYQIVLYSSGTASRAFGLCSPNLFDPATGNIDCARVSLGTVMTSSPVEAGDALVPWFLRGAQRAPLLSLPDLATRFYRATHPYLAFSAPLFRVHVSLGTMTPEIFCNVGTDVDDLDAHLAKANAYKFKAAPRASGAAAFSTGGHASGTVPSVVALSTASRSRSSADSGDDDADDDDEDDSHKKDSADIEMDGAERHATREIDAQVNLCELQTFRNSCDFVVDDVRHKLTGPSYNYPGGDRHRELAESALFAILSVYDDTSVCQRLLSERLPGQTRDVEEAETIFCQARTAILSYLHDYAARLVSIQSLQSIVASVNTAFCSKYMYCKCHFHVTDATVERTSARSDALDLVALRWTRLAQTCGRSVLWTIPFAARDLSHASAPSSSDGSRVPVATRLERVKAAWHTWVGVNYDLHATSTDGQQGALPTSCYDYVCRDVDAQHLPANSLWRPFDTAYTRLRAAIVSLLATAPVVLAAEAALVTIATTPISDAKEETIVPFVHTLDAAADQLRQASEHAAFGTEPPEWRAQVLAARDAVRMYMDIAAIWESVTAPKKLKKAHVAAHFTDLVKQLEETSIKWQGKGVPLQSTRFVADKLKSRISDADPVYGMLHTSAEKLYATLLEQRTPAAASRAN